MILSRSVLLLKSQHTDGPVDKYEDLLASNGFEVRQVKTLVFDFKNLTNLKEKLINSDAYQGIIFSSPRCVQAVHLAVENEKNIILPWRQKYNFVVGENTHTQASSRLDLECEGKESGNAANLSKVILEKKLSSPKPFLFPHGNLKADTLNLQLGEGGIQIEGVLVYDTIANPNIVNEISNATNNLTSMSEYVVFFSPTGFRSSIEHLKRVPVDLNKIKLIAIGPVTELAIKEGNCNVYGVTKQPTPKDLLDLLLKD